MGIRRGLSMLVTAVMFVAIFSGIHITGHAYAANVYKSFDFTTYSNAPIYSEDTGFGFVAETSAMPPRKLDVNKIEKNSEGFSITEDGSGGYIHNTNSNDYNYGGLVFRVDVDEPGGYSLTVELGNGSNKSNTAVAPSGMQASTITGSNYWDSSKLVPVKNYAKWANDTTWKYDYVTGEKYIEFEIEPSTQPKATSPMTVGLKSITIEKIPQNSVSSGDLPAVYVLGDSTEKTYTFEEAGMSGWGQIIGSMFDSSKVKVTNYSMGGRSMKKMFTENRFNDVLLNAKPGDYIMIHSAHNDESTGASDGPEARFGRGSNTEYYTRWLNEIYIPAILSRGATPILVTSMPRTNNGVAGNGFTPDAPGLMRKAAASHEGVELVELFTKSKEYLDDMGTAQTNAIFMAIEAGETPGKTNSGSYANGHPDNKIDGTHYKEAASKVWSKFIAEEISENENLSDLADALSNDVKDAISSDDWGKVFPEWTDDVTYAKSGDGTAANDPTYYRNQIEKMLQLGAMQKADGNNFKPLEKMNTNDFISSLCAVWGLDLSDSAVKSVFEPYFESGTLIREEMAAIILDAYELRFGKNSDGSYKKPRYMTDYNGSTVSPDDPTYDPNLTGAEAQYYPLVGWGNLTDKEDISLEYAQDVYNVYNLGLMRSEIGIERGKMKNGTLFQPKTDVTRAKAAKELWFLWVLGQNNVLAENQILGIAKSETETSDIVYTPIEYTSPGYEFSSVNIGSDGKLSVELLKSDGAENGTLSIKIYNTDGTEKEAKTYNVSKSGEVAGIDITLTIGEKAVMSVTSSAGAKLSAERTVICTELIVPQRSYTVSNAAGIKNGIIGIKNLSEESAETASIAALAENEEAVEWVASKDVTKDQVLLDSSENGECDLVATFDMSYTSINSFTIDGRSFDGYVAHASVNGYLKNANRDRSGMLFTPKSDGVLTVYAQNVGADKNFLIIDDEATSETQAIASSKDEGKSINCSITAVVEAGKTYYIGVTGSKGRFAAVSFISGAPVVSVLAKEGETVEVTATPNVGYVVSSVTATDSDGNTVKLTSNANKTVSTFVMPESDVTINAVFVMDDNEYVYGDADNDGDVTEKDAKEVMKKVLLNDSYKTELENQTDNYLLYLDVDVDKKLTATDAAIITQKSILKDGYKMPVEQ